MHRTRQTIIEAGQSANFNCSIVNFSQGCNTGWHVHEVLRRARSWLRRCSPAPSSRAISATIAAAVEEQGAATQEIARNVQHAAQGAQEVTTNITDVKDGAASTGDAAGHVLGVAGQLAHQAAELTREIDAFVSGVRAA